MGTSQNRGGAFELRDSALGRDHVTNASESPTATKPAQVALSAPGPAVHAYQSGPAQVPATPTTPQAADANMAQATEATAATTKPDVAQAAEASGDVTTKPDVAQAAEASGDVAQATENADVAQVAEASGDAMKDPPKLERKNASECLPKPEGPRANMYSIKGWDAEVNRAWRSNGGDEDRKGLLKKDWSCEIKEPANATPTDMCIAIFSDGEDFGLYSFVLHLHF